MDAKQKTALRAVIAAQVALWEAERGYEQAVGGEVTSFEAVGEFAIDAENVSDGDLETLAAQLPTEMSDALR